MGFTSIEFAAFAGLLLIVYYRIPKDKQWQLLLTAGMLFYIRTGLRYFFFLVFTAASSFGTAVVMMKNREQGKQKTENRKWLTICLLANFSLLAICKVFLLFPKSGCFLSLGLPLGMSFYCFQSAGYVIDVYRGREGETHFLKYLLYVSYFPQLIQGPISKFSDLAPQLTAHHAFDKKEVSFGLQRMLWGYFKKLVIADRIGVAVATLRGPTYLGFPFFLLTVFYAVQIYADFTGGIDIALGLSQSLGIHLPENFLRPFFSKNIAQYWRRWHITLGAWMREYIFFPVSISKPLRKLSKTARKHLGGFGKRLPVYVASLVTWLATGIWHGLTPNFALWGLLNCLVILLSEEMTPLFEKFYKQVSWKNKKWYSAFEIIRTFLLMNFIRACDLFPNILDYVHRIGSLFRRWEFSFLWDGSMRDLGLSTLDFCILGVGIMCILAVSLIQEKVGSLRQLLWGKPVLREALNVILLTSILLVGRYGVGYDSASFIYNQF